MPQRFSTRTNWNTTESAYAAAIRDARAAGRLLYDLTASNPTACGFQYDTESILAPLANPAALAYEPDPRGIRRAREAVAAYYADHGASVDPNHIQLTTSTSEAYSYLFRLLCNPGDEMLVAQPSYPLFDFLADLDDVQLKPYPLFYDHGWCIDFASLEQSITPQTRAILVVHPNNPTGHFTQAQERTHLEQLCRKHELALIVDEVFLDYGLGAGDDAASFAAVEHPVLTFVLSGMSKIAGLPQMKAAWIVSTGPAAELQQALPRLEVIADTFLSMNAPVQHALSSWLEQREQMQRQIRARTQANLQELDRQLAGQSHISRLGVEAGWNAVLRVPAVHPDEEEVQALIRDQGVISHPGSFYGFPKLGWQVLSLLVPEEEFCAGLSRLLGHFAGLQVEPR
ncbi:MAG: pyridoxal phosphate-dependent aminotransferase [Acidobacteriaceae bacterium]